MVVVTWLLSDEAKLSGFRASICFEAISRTFAARCGWMQCLLHTAVFDCRQGVVVREPTRSIVNALVTQVWDFILAVGQFAIKRRLRYVSSRGHTHIQGGAASRDSNSGENIRRPGFRCCEPSGLCGDAWVREF